MDKKLTILPKYHGAVCGYNKTDLTIDFMNTWYLEYIKQRTTGWSYIDFDVRWKVFDMFTLWRMTSGRFEEYERFKSEAQQENDALIRLFNKKMSLFEIPFISESNDDIRSAIRRSGDDLFLDFLYFDILKKIMIENNYTYVELLDYLEKVKDEKIESK